MTSADVVEIVFEDVIASDVALGVDHRVGILLTVFADVLTTIGQVGVEHTLEFDTHHIAPFGFCREIEQVALGNTLHL